MTCDYQLANGQIFGPWRASRHSAAVATGITVHANAGPSTSDRVLPRPAVDIGQWAVGVVAGQVAVPQLLEEIYGRLAADLLQPHLVRQLPSLLVRVAQNECCGG